MTASNEIKDVEAASIVGDTRFNGRPSPAGHSRSGKDCRVFSPCNSNLTRHSSLCILFLSVFILSSGNDNLRAADEGGPNIYGYSAMLKRVLPSVVTVLTSEMAFGHDTPLVAPGNNAGSGLYGEQIPEEPDTRFQGLGSGVVVGKDGLILTANHVIADADRIYVKIEGDNSIHDVTKVLADPGSDLALLSIAAHNLPVLPLADSDKAEVGDLVFAVGNPMGLSQTVTGGILSAIGRAGVGDGGYTSYLQTDAALNPGNSGGALVDINGHLLGINAEVYEMDASPKGIGLAIPSHTVQIVMRSLLDKGRVARVYLGTRLQTLTPELASALKARTRVGALVCEVETGSPAETAGFHGGDIIVSIAGSKVESPHDVRRSIGAVSPGTKISMKIERQSSEREIGVVLGVIPVADSAVDDTPSGQHRVFQTVEVIPGVQAADTDREVRDLLGLPEKVSGPVVVSVDTESAASQANLRKGNVIEEVNRERVKNSAGIVRAVKSADSREPLLLRIWRNGGSIYVSVHTS